MESQIPHSRRIQAQLQALSDEIQRIRKEHDSHITGLGQRLREAEGRQRRLRHQLNVAINRSVDPLDDNHSWYSSSLINPDSPVSRSGALARTSRNVSSLQELTGGMIGSGSDGAGYSSPSETNLAVYRRAPSRLPPAQLAELDATPRPHSAVLHSYQDGLQPKKEQQALGGSKDNAAYLPMVMENIMAERHRHDRDGTLRLCGFVLEEGRGNGVRCSQNSFHMPCFRAHHFYYCRQHMRVIPSAKMVCSHRDKQHCLVVVFEDREDWDAIVDAALAAGNLGNKGVDTEELKEALFPPQNYPHRYMGAAL